MLLYSGVCYVCMCATAFDKNTLHVHSSLKYRSLEKQVFPTQEEEIENETFAVYTGTRVLENLNRLKRNFLSRIKQKEKSSTAGVYIVDYTSFDSE